VEIQAFQNKQLLTESAEHRLETLLQLYTGYCVPKIEDAEFKEVVLTWTKDIKLITKELDVMQAEFLKPLKSMQDAIKAKFKPVLEALEKAEKLNKQRVIDYTQEQQRLAEAQRQRQQEEENRIAEEKRKKLLEEAEAAALFGSKVEAAIIEEKAAAVQPAKIGVVVPKPEGMRKIWKFRITDPSKLQRIWLKPDEVKIGQFVRENKGQVEIEGVEIYSEDSLAVRTS
jgi:hypothetical protein